MITLEKAVAALRASEMKAKELNTFVSTAIVDDYGVLIAFSKMDGAIHVSPKFAQAKAYSAAMLMLPTADVAQYAGEGKPYFSINTAYAGDFMLVAGGVPVKKDNTLIGAVGVGGSLDVAQDVQCAQAAATVLAA